TSESLMRCLVRTRLARPRRSSDALVGRLRGAGLRGRLALCAPRPLTVGAVPRQRFVRDSGAADAGASGTRYLSTKMSLPLDRDAVLAAFRADPERPLKTKEVSRFLELPADERGALRAMLHVLVD